MSEDELKDSEQPLNINQESNNLTLADGIEPNKDERDEWINYIFKGRFEEIDNKLHQAVDSIITSLLPDEERKKREEEKKKLEEEHDKTFDILFEMALEEAAISCGGTDSPEYIALIAKLTKEPTLPWLEHEHGHSKENSVKGIRRFFTMEDYHRIRDQEHPEEIVCAIEHLIKKMTTAGSDAIHGFNRKAKEFAIKKAAERWKKDAHITKDEMAEYIQGHIEEEFKNEIAQDKSKVPELATIKKWITDSVPSERKKGGRPPNSRAR